MQRNAVAKSVHRLTLCIYVTFSYGCALYILFAYDDHNDLEMECALKCDLKINAFSCSQFEEVFLTKREHYEKLVNGKFSKSLVVL